MELDALEVGDIVKIIFVGTGRDQDDIERMWVEVTLLEGDQITGNLANEPFGLRSIKLGDEIQFQRSDIIDLEKYRFEDSRPIANDLFFARCYADPDLINGDEKPRLFYREAPIDDDSDAYKDTGWRFCGASAATQDSKLDMSKAQRIAIGVLLNQDDSYLELLGSDVGTRCFRAQPDRKFSLVSK